MKKKILFVCGSVNQTSMMHQIALHFPEYDCFFTPYYIGDFRDELAKRFFDFSILGGKYKEQTLHYLKSKAAAIDYKGAANNYDFAVTCQDLIIQKNIKNNPVFLVQEGMTDPQRLGYFLVKNFGFPRFIAGTSATGLSDAYELFFVASQGFKEVFVKKGISPEKIVVTGMPNFDNTKQFLNNDFPYKHFVLAATSNLRECLEYENRRKFIQKIVRIAHGRQIVFKLHPSENVKRAVREIMRYAPNSLVFEKGNTNHMVANCDVLVTRFSSVVFIGEALGKEIHADVPIDEIKKLAPIQNNGTSAGRIAQTIKNHLEKKSTLYRLYHATHSGFETPVRNSPQRFAYERKLQYTAEEISWNASSRQLKGCD